MTGALKIALRIATCAIASTAICTSVPAAVAAPAPSVAGTWHGPLFGTVFIFEFEQRGTGWTGRYQSEKYGKWVDLQKVSFADDIVRFSFDSKPPLSFELKFDAQAKTLNGTTMFAQHAIPVNLTARPN
ncbi:MAG TPA: hypothetical protein VIA98_03140 [Allosphingosinicella sp.]|jgi:hypothetical protein